VLYFPSPNTSTGESVLELHVHGGPAIIRAILAAIASLYTSSLPIRYAQAGEFTRRAFLADRLSLPQIEALGDTLSAETEEQRRLSVAGTRSGLAARYESWRQQLLSARGELEALIDFSEDQHFDESPGELAANVAHLVRSLIRVMTLHSANAMRGELLRAGIKLSLIGAPNVGKSSLLNQIVGRRAAIVSAQAGTTRDVVEVGIDLGGFFCRLGDTAGLRVESTVGDVEAEGIRMAKERALESDVIVLVASIELGDATDLTVHIAAEVLETANELLKRGKRVVVALNKVDRVEKTTSFSSLIAQTYNLLPALTPGNVFPISCHQAEENASDGLQVESPPHNTSTTATNPPFGDPGNIQALLTGLTSIFRTLTSAVLPIPTSTTDITSTPGTEADESTYADALSATARQRNLLDSCTAELRTFLSLVDNANDTRGVETDLVLAAEALRSAASCLAQITGKGGEVGMGGDVEEVLGVVFERYGCSSTDVFCGGCFF